MAVLGGSSSNESAALALLPLALLLAGHPRRWAWPLLAFVAGALLCEEIEALVVVAVRNVALLVLFGVVVLRVWWLRERSPNAGAAAGPRLAAPRRGL